MLFRKPESNCYIPPKIPKAHLSNSRLLDCKKNADEIEHIFNSLIDCPDGYYSKKDPLFSKKTFSDIPGHHLQYSVIKENDHYYAVYRGKKHGMDIAEGGFGVLKYAQDIESGKFVAVKVINPRKHAQFAGKEVDYKRITESIRSEADALNAIHRLPSYANNLNLLDQKHPFYLYKRKQQLIDDKKLILVMDLEMGEDGFYFIEKRSGTLSTTMCLTIAKNMVAAWRELFAQGILHRDVKLDNFMIDENGQVRLIDFGFAVRLDRSQSNPCFIDTHAVGTEQYMSPELKISPRYSEQTEVYAMGVCFGLIYHYGFDKNTKDGQSQHIQSLFGRLSSSMLKADPERRPSMSAVELALNDYLDKVEKKAESECAVTMRK